MDDIVTIEDFKSQCVRELSDSGRLRQAIPDFVVRLEQQTLTEAIANAFDTGVTLVAEAGTGTGKTFAYLVPCLLSRKKILISTATKTLQDQLFDKDLPTLVKILGRPVRIQNLKGRANYLCHYRIALHAETSPLALHTDAAANSFLYVREKLPQLVDGVRSELPEVTEDSPVWPYVTSNSENCLGYDCPYSSQCFLLKARKRALEADIVVINHHLFFADLALKEDGFGALLPGVDVVVFDEAHQLADIATNFFGDRLGSRQLFDLLDDILREWPILDLANQPLKKLHYDCLQETEQLSLIMQKYDERLSWDDIVRNTSWLVHWQKLLTLCEEISDCFNSVDLTEHSGLARCALRMRETINLLRAFLQTDNVYIKWLERFKRNQVFHRTPVSVADVFKSIIAQQNTTYIFTSATLTFAASFDCFLKTLGLESVTTLALASPFNFQEQAMLYLPRGLPDSKHARYYDVFLEKTLPIVKACGGRCFFLFTSHRALQLMATKLQQEVDYPLLVQGEEAKPILLARFRALGNAILLGTATFWEGVDVKGEALSCVIIDKIPFASPTDPVIRGKMAHLKAQGLSSFAELFLPNAVLALKQGAGRLIRDVNDVGVLMIADPRVTGRSYGQSILASMPPMRKTRDENTILAFINKIGLV